VIALPAHAIAHVEEVGQAHVRARLRAGDGAAINAIASAPPGKSSDRPCSRNVVASCMWPGRCPVDRWQGNERIQLRMIDVAPADPVERSRA